MSAHPQMELRRTCAGNITDANQGITLPELNIHKNPTIEDNVRHRIIRFRIKQECA